MPASDGCRPHPECGKAQITYCVVELEGTALSPKMRQWMLWCICLVILGSGWHAVLGTIRR